MRVGEDEGLIYSFICKLVLSAVFFRKISNFSCFAKDFCGNPQKSFAGLTVELYSANTISPQITEMQCQSKDFQRFVLSFGGNRISL